MRSASDLELSPIGKALCTTEACERNQPSWPPQLVMAIHGRELSPRNHFLCSVLCHSDEELWLQNADCNPKYSRLVAGELVRNANSRTSAQNF